MSLMYNTIVAKLAHARTFSGGRWELPSAQPLITKD